MSVLQSSIDALAAPPDAGGFRSSRAVVAFGRAVVGFVTIFAVFAASEGAAAAATDTLVTGALWLGALHFVQSNRVLSQLPSDTYLAAAISATLALVAAFVGAVFLGSVNLATSELTLGPAMAVASYLYELVAVRQFGPRSRVLIVGSGASAAHLMSDLSACPGAFSCVGIVRDGDGDGAAGGRVLGDISSLPAIIKRERPDLVVLERVDDADGVMHDLLDTASTGFRILDVRQFYEHAFGRVPLQGLTPSWFMSVLHLYRRPYSRITKRAFDVVVAVAAGALAAPLIPIVALCVRLSGPGPVLFRQTRVGEGGREFDLVKFRTMVVGAEGDGVAVWASKRDPRVSPVGRVLRRTRFDEVPQLWNVLRGDMSMVGPRPERPEFIELLTSELPYWTRRHLVKPGITGWAQVRCGYTDDSLGAAEKLSYDLYYLKHRSLLLDVVIAARTVGVVVTGSGAH